MKVTCLIDSLCSGGAQRQLCTLAVLLKRHGWDVSTLTYHPMDFFLPMIRAAGIGYECIESRSVAARIRSLRRALRGGSQDVVLAFLDGPCLYAELASLPTRRWGLVISERVAAPTERRSRMAWLRRLYRLADYVTTNSHTNRLLIERAVPSLRQRTATIYNAVDLEAFSPAPVPPARDEREIHLVVAARYEPQKNPAGLIKALAIVRSSAPWLKVRLDWYGRRAGPDEAAVYDHAAKLVHECALEDSVYLNLESPAVVELYRAADAVALPSLFEGLPNTICEAMACGRPVLMSNVSDAGNLVKDGHNGFLFDARSSDDMARAIIQFGNLSRAEREAMGVRGRQMAERMFSPTDMAEHYMEVLSAAASRQRIAIEHWPSEVPDSAGSAPSGNSCTLHCRR